MYVLSICKSFRVPTPFLLPCKWNIILKTTFLWCYKALYLILQLLYLSVPLVKLLLKVLKEKYNLTNIHTTCNPLTSIRHIPYSQQLAGRSLVSVSFSPRSPSAAVFSNNHSPLAAPPLCLQGSSSTPQALRLSLLRTWKLRQTRPVGSKTRTNQDDEKKSHNQEDSERCILPSLWTLFLKLSLKDIGDLLSFFF